MKNIWIAFSFLILASCASYEKLSPATQYKMGNNFYYGKNGESLDWEEAHTLFKLAAAKGNLSAYNKLGHMYFSGQFVEKDIDKGLSFYSIAAEGGYLRTQNDLGLLYNLGHEVPRDIEKSIKWYSMAAAQNDLGAKLELAELYYHNKDRKIAADLLLEIVNAEGNKDQRFIARAKAKVGQMYMHGDALPKDEWLGSKYLLESLLFVNKGYSIELARLYSEGIGTKKDLYLAAKYISKGAKYNQDERKALLDLYERFPKIRKNLELKEKWFLSNAIDGDAESQYYLALIYKNFVLNESENGKKLNGYRLNKYTEDAFKYLHKSANQNFSKAQYEIGHAYIDGLGISRSTATGLKWIEKSALNEYPPAMSFLGVFSLKQNQEKEGVKWLSKAAKAGNKGAQVILGDYYAKEKENYNESLKWHSMAADQGSLKALITVATRYALGHGVDKDIPEATKWLQKLFQGRNEEGLDDLLVKLNISRELVTVN